MAAQTKATVADYGQIFLTPGSHKTLAALPNPLSLDLLAIFGEGGKCLVKVSSTGVVSKNPTTHTTKALFNHFYSRLASTATLQQISNDVWSENKSQQDILQVRAQGGIGIWHLDYTLTAFSS
jgi:hypothetical protein